MTQRKTQKQYDQLSSSKIILISIMSSSLKTNCLLLVLLPISTIIKNCYLPFVLSCPLSNNFLPLRFFCLRAGHLSSSSLRQTRSELFFSVPCGPLKAVVCQLGFSFSPVSITKLLQSWAGQMCGCAGNTGGCGSRGLMGTEF